MDLQGQAVVITGGASGLGAATAALFASKGAKIALLDLNEAIAKENAAKFGGVGIKCDVTSGPSAEAALAEAREANGPVRILVNCAGVATPGRIVGRAGPLALESFDLVVRINLIGTFNLMRLAAVEMAASEPLADGERGVMINTASVAAFEGQIGQAAYAASKGGVAALTLPAARELARDGIRVVTIAPGVFHTPMVDGLGEKVQESLAADIPFPHRLGRAEEYALLAEHIVTNRYLNGSVIRLDASIRMAAR